MHMPARSTDVIETSGQEQPFLAERNRLAAGFFRATFYKEWIKLRLYWTLLLLGSTGYAAYLCLWLRYLHQFNDAVSVWGAWIFKGFLFFAPFSYVPLVVGVTLGAIQFLPETLNKRIRLALHLPLGENRIISYHLLSGLLGLAVALFPATALFVVTGLVYFPAEFQRNLLLTLAPWILAGFAGYLLTAALLLENAWRYRVFYLLLSGAALRLFFLGEFYDVYQRALAGFAVWTAALFLLPLLSSYRFRKGLA